jgi:hypothetical protein
MNGGFIKMEFIECKTQKEVDACCKKGDIAIVRSGIFIACGNSQVRAYGSSQVRAYGSSQVRAYDSTQVRAYDSSQVRAYGSSQVRAYDSSQVRAYDSSQVIAYDSSQVRACGYVAVTQQSNFAIIYVGKNCTLLKVPNIDGISDYCERYPVKQDGDYIYLYKATKPDRISFYDNKTQYPESGIIKTDKLAPKEAGSCAKGLHFSHYDWAVNFGLQHDDFIILKARIKKDRIVVSPDCNGKIRTDEAEIVEVIKDWQHYKPDFEEGIC